MILREVEGDLDRSSVLELIRENPELPQWNLANLAGAGEPMPNDLRRRLFLAVDGGHLLGFAQTVIVTDEAELESMAVAVACRGKGVGRLLLQHALKQARQDGAEVFLLEVRQSNAAARSLYEKAGMQMIGQRRGYYRDPVEDAVLMEVRWNRGPSDG